MRDNVTGYTVLGLALLFQIAAFVLGCGRSWRGERLEREELLIIPKASEIFSSPELDTEIRQWDFVLDDSDVPHVAFYDSFQGVLSYSTLDLEGEWTTETVDPLDRGKGVLVGSSPNIFFVNDRLHVVYLSSSIRDKVPKFYIIKESVRDPILGVWRCRIVKKWASPISVLRAGYLKHIDKIGLVFLDAEEKKLMFGVFSPAEDKELKPCVTPSSEEEERENSDIALVKLYYFGQGNIRLVYEADKTCNTIASRVGYSVDIIPTFIRRRESMVGVSIYDPVLNQTYWIDFKQSDVLTWKDSRSAIVERKRGDQEGISYMTVEHKVRDPENRCVLVTSVMYKVELSRPAEAVDRLLYKNYQGHWKEVSFISISPTELVSYLPPDPAYPLEVSIVYTPSFMFNVYGLGDAKSNLSVAADKDGNIHIANFAYIPPRMAVEYGIIAIGDDGRHRVVFETLDGGGEGIYTQGTGGIAVSVRSDGVPIVAYFSPFTADLKIAIPVRETWLSVSKLTGPISGIHPKMNLTRNQNIAVILSPVIYGHKNSLMMIFVPLTL